MVDLLHLIGRCDVQMNMTEDGDRNDVVGTFNRLLQLVIKMLL